MPLAVASHQLVLDLKAEPAFRRDDFLLASSNSSAFEAVEAWPQWPTGLLLIDGPAGAGKSHLAHIWAERAQACRLEPADLWQGAALDPTIWQRLGAHSHAVLDDADQASDEPLLQLYNILRERSGSLLLTASAPLGAWLPRLPDLASRLLTAWTVHIGAPHDELLTALVLKQFADRQLTVEAGVVAYLVRHMERSFAFARQIVDACDRTCWQIKRPLTLPLARAVLARELAQSQDRT